MAVRFPGCAARASEFCWIVVERSRRRAGTLVAPGQVRVIRRLEKAESESKVWLSGRHKKERGISTCLVDGFICASAQHALASLHTGPHDLSWRFRCMCARFSATS